MRRLVARSSDLPAPAEPATPPPPTGSPPPPTPARSTPAPSPARAPSPEREDRSPRSAPREPTAAAASAASIGSIITVAERSGRSDLAERLRASQQEIRRTGVTVAVVGEFKKGKSSLVNALVNAEVCPADPILASVAPVTVAHGDEFSVTVTYGDGRTETETQPDHLADVASERGNEANRLGVRRVDATLPRRLLAAGLHLVDLPGVGGLDSAVGAINLASLDAADGALFVTDCSQELTAPELSFLGAAHARCPAMVCVMTKRDLHRHSATLLERNRQHLERAGLGHVPVLAVSSTLHLVALAQGDPDLEREAGFAELFDALYSRIWEPARRQGLAQAGRQLADLADHLSLPAVAAQQSHRSPADAQRVLQRLGELEQRVHQLRTATMRWQQRLAEGVNDATSDLDHELRDRLRSLARTADGRVEAGDPTADMVFEAWLHKSAMETVVVHYGRIGERMNALSDEVAEQFLGLDRKAAFEVASDMPAAKLADVRVTRDQEVTKDGVVRRVVTTGQGYSSGIVLTSSMFGLFGGAFLIFPALALPVAGVMARRAFVDDRDRRAASRRNELKRMANRYLDEVGFIVHKDARDAIRRIHREIREHYLERTEQLEETLRQARAAAEQAVGAAPVPSPDPGSAAATGPATGATPSAPSAPGAPAGPPAAVAADDAPHAPAATPEYDRTVDVIRSARRAANRLVAVAPGKAAPG